MTVNDLTSRANITEVAVGLGARPPIVRGRTPAFYRKNSGRLNLSLNDARGCWYDHKLKIGGGILDLIQRTQNCTPKEAAQWLSDYLGIALDSNEWTPEQRREYARRRSLAEQRAGDFIQWKKDLLDKWRETSALYAKIYRVAERFIDNYSPLFKENPYTAEDLMDAAEIAHVYNEHLEAMDNAIDVFENASWNDLLPFYERDRAKAGAEEQSLRDQDQELSLIGSDGCQQAVAQ